MRQPRSLSKEWKNWKAELYGCDRQTLVSCQQAWPYRQMHVGVEPSSATYRSTTYYSTKSFALQNQVLARLH